MGRKIFWVYGFEIDYDQIVVAYFVHPSTENYHLRMVLEVEISGIVVSCFWTASNSLDYVALLLFGIWFAHHEHDGVGEYLKCGSQI